MSSDDLRSFIHLLEQADQLARISTLVDPYLELAGIVDRVSKGAGRGRGLLFETVQGTAMPVAANLFGSLERVGWALGTTDLEETAHRFAADLLATGEVDGECALRILSGKEEWQPTIGNNPVCRTVNHSRQGLRVLPLVTAWPGDGGPYLTMAQTYSRPPDGGALNCGMYRIQIHDSHTATMRCRSGSGAARHLAAWHARGVAMPVAVALGGPPILNWAAAASLPGDVEEAAFCGYLRGRPLSLSNCQSCDLQVPASAEVVIEGVIEPGATRSEGPFGNHTGSYDVETVAPVLKVLSVHAREGAICPWTLVGPPPMENIQLARATAGLFLPLVRMSLPTLRSLHLPAEGMFHRAALVTVDPDEKRPLKEVARLLWGTSLLKGARLLVIGAADHDPRDPSAVFWRVLNRTDWQRDLLIENSQMAIDARRLPSGEPVHCDPGVLAKVYARWHEYGLDGDD
ncbi:MAG: UbiD family decarboxylase [Desulfuromonas sp.]|nr:UbiD family decarboxylase [Desulfuromonas sp.]